MGSRNQIQLIIFEPCDLGHLIGFNYTIAEVGQKKVKNKKVKCHLSMKFSAVFDQNPSHTLDKKCQTHSEKDALKA